MANLDVVSTTSLEVEAKPGPAQVYLDSRTLGLLCEAAPTCSRPILPGRYKVIVERPGYLRATKQLQIEAGTRANVVLTLTEKHSSLTVTTSVPAEVSIDGQPVGPSPVTRELPAGEHQIEVSSPGHGSEKGTAALHLGEPATLDVTLCELVGLAVTPAEGTVEVDGAPARREADGKLCVAPGEHTYAIVEDGDTMADRNVPTTALREGREVTWVEAPDCDQPGVRVARAPGTAFSSPAGWYRACWPSCRHPLSASVSKPRAGSRLPWRACRRWR